MKKSLFSLVFLSITYYGQAQVGIGTDTPQSTLDIKEKRTGSTNDVTAHDGVLIPKLTKTELANKALTAYTTAQIGTMIYVSDVTEPTGSPISSAQVGQITTTGYYIFTSTGWTKLLNATDADTTNDAWVNNSANTRVELGTTSTGAARTAGTEVVATDTGRVGIKTATPNASLEVKKSSTTPTTSVDGIIPPNMTKSELANKTSGTYGTAQTGAVVYVSDATPPTGTPASSAQVTNIKAAGFYTFDGRIWQPISGAIQKVMGVIVLPKSNIQTFTGPSGTITQNDIIVLDNLPTTYHLGSYIDLDPGKWEVEATVLIEIQSGVTGLNNIYTKFSFTETNNLSTGVAKTNDILAGDAFLIGGLVTIFGVASGNTNPNYSVVNGKIIITNGSTAKKRYYLMYQQGIRKFSNFQSAAGTTQTADQTVSTTSTTFPRYYNIGSSLHGENYISAIRIQ